MTSLTFVIVRELLGMMIAKRFNLERRPAGLALEAQRGVLTLLIA